MKTLITTVLFTSFLLAGCGGSTGDAAPPPTSEVPASASTSVDDFIAYLKALVTASADTLEPVDISGVAPPLDETREPVSVD